MLLLGLRCVGLPLGALFEHCDCQFGGVLVLGCYRIVRCFNAGLIDVPHFSRWRIIAAHHAWLAGIEQLARWAAPGSGAFLRTAPCYGPLMGRASHRFVERLPAVAAAVEAHQANQQRLSEIWGLESATRKHAECTGQTHFEISITQNNADGLQRSSGRAGPNPLTFPRGGD